MPLLLGNVTPRPLTTAEMTLQHAEVGIVIAGRHFLLQIVVALVPWFRVDQHEDEDEAEEKK